MIILRLCDTPLFAGVFKPIDTTEKEICSRFSGVSNPPGKASAMVLVESLSGKTPLGKASIVDLVEFSFHQERPLP